MRALPVLEARRTSMDTCIHCPKLCRGACPVSEATPVESLTPWGKVAIASFEAHGDVDVDDHSAGTAWACTGCHACRSECKHGNDVAGTLFDVRDAVRRHGLLPAARATLLDFDAHLGRTARAAKAFDTGRDPGGTDTALLVGCGYLRMHAGVARDIVGVARAYSRSEVDVRPECCGLPLLHAGDAEGFGAHAKSVARSLSRYRSVLVGDPGCAFALRVLFANSGATIRGDVELVLERVHRGLERLRMRQTEAVRWHDPRQLGRGLGIYDAPREILRRVTGTPPREFRHVRENGRCSGGGAMLPATRPATARKIADARLREHGERGGGVLVTACASSLKSFGHAEGHPVRDLHSLVAEALG
ncbi:MAG: (Fe-S)-binding protein [Polyangiaceae bacterium]